MIEECLPEEGVLLGRHTGNELVDKTRIQVLMRRGNSFTQGEEATCAQEKC